MENNGLLPDTVSEELADQDNLFATCDVDEEKFTIAGNCEVGIALFCRNQFFSSFDTSTATKAEFVEICTCVDTLCAALPSDDNVGESLLLFSRALYGILSAACVLGILIYGMILVDMICCGGLYQCKWQ